LRELRRGLRGLDDGAEWLREMRDINKAAADVVVRNVDAPRLSGDLAANVRAASAGTAAKVKAGGVKIPYAGVIHYGWPDHNIAPQPFLEDAVGESRDDMMTLYMDLVGALTAAAFPN